MTLGAALNVFYQSEKKDDTMITDWSGGTKPGP